MQDREKCRSDESISLGQTGICTWLPDWTRSSECVLTGRVLPVPQFPGVTVSKAESRKPKAESRKPKAESRKPKAHYNWRLR
jgi:hypothetical protein